MALKLNAFNFQSHKYSSSFVHPPMLSLRSPKFFMAASLTSGTKWVSFFLFFSAFYQFLFG